MKAYECLAIVEYLQDNYLWVVVLGVKDILFCWQTCKRKEIDYIRYYDCVNWKWCHLTFQSHSLLNFSIIIDKNFLTYIHQTNLTLNVYRYERREKKRLSCRWLDQENKEENWSWQYVTSNQDTICQMKHYRTHFLSFLPRTYVCTLDKDQFHTSWFLLN